MLPLFLYEEEKNKTRSKNTQHIPPVGKFFNVALGSRKGEDLFMKSDSPSHQRAFTEGKKGEPIASHQHAVSHASEVT